MILKKSHTIDFTQIRSAEWEDHKSYVPGHPPWSSITLIEKNGKQIKIGSEPDDQHTNQLRHAYEAINQQVSQFN